jgi:hypothetical protein
MEAGKTIKVPCDQGHGERHANILATVVSKKAGMPGKVGTMPVVQALDVTLLRILSDVKIEKGVVIKLSTFFIRERQQTSQLCKGPCSPR